jgi:hypothetical protein
MWYEDLDRGFILVCRHESLFLDNSVFMMITSSLNGSLLRGSNSERRRDYASVAENYSASPPPPPPLSSGGSNIRCACAQPTISSLCFTSHRIAKPANPDLARLCDNFRIVGAFGRVSVLPLSGSTRTICAFTFGHPGLPPHHAVYLVTGAPQNRRTAVVSANHQSDSFSVNGRSCCCSVCPVGPLRSQSFVSLKQLRAIHVGRFTAYTHKVCVF